MNKYYGVAKRCSILSGIVSVPYVELHTLLPRDATQSAVMPQYVVCLSVRLSVYM